MKNKPGSSKSESGRVRGSVSAAQRRLMQMVLQNPNKAKKLGYKIPKSVALKYLEADHKNGVTTESLPERAPAPEPKPKKMAPEIPVNTVHVSSNDKKTAQLISQISQTDTIVMSYDLWKDTSVPSRALSVVLVSDTHAWTLRRGNMSNNFLKSEVTLEYLKKTAKESHSKRITFLSDSRRFQDWLDAINSPTIANDRDSGYIMRDESGINTWMASRVSVRQASVPLRLKIVQGDGLVDIDYHIDTRTALPLRRAVEL